MTKSRFYVPFIENGSHQYNRIRRTCFFLEILAKIQSEKSWLEESIGNLTEQIKEARDHLWLNNREYDAAEKASLRQAIDQSTMSKESHSRRLQRLDKLCASPYFGRFDFTKDPGSLATLVYVGIHDFSLSSDHQQLIYDWRAPISSIFYDWELGPVWYQSPKGRVEGQVDLKRQYSIRESRFLFMIESAVSVHDEILQNVLGSVSDDKMRNIVSTIQRDQNAIIRNDASDVLVIQGVAGSGKTSIALHRVAYLLYRHKDTISAQDVLILSPNRVFSDYISQVLPELGEENIPEIRMEEIADKILEEKIKYETFEEQIYRLVENPEPKYVARVSFKAEPEFLEKLNKYIFLSKAGEFAAQDIPLGPYVIPADFIDKQYNAASNLSPGRRITRVVESVIKFDKRLRITPEQEASLRKAVRSMVKKRSLTGYYRDFFKWMGHPEILKNLSGSRWEYADVFPLAYLSLRMKGGPDYGHVRHLVVDEMQDYTAVQYKILTWLFKCRKTILGDASQKINPACSSTGETIHEAFPDSELIRLQRSYRSSYEIIRFAQGVAPDADLIPMERHGQEPEVVVTEGESAMHDKLINWATAFKDSGFKSLAIICRRAAQVKRVAAAFADAGLEAHTLDAESSHLNEGIIITTAYLAKGLEFDQVIVPYVSADEYEGETDRGLLYVACTRAMHQLDLAYFGQKSKLLDFFSV
ncbi:MAG: AAA family ATPase [Fibrobacteria bacterium]|nr:AAA family ATPase [Fibrobacteria bacterium]